MLLTTSAVLRPAEQVISYCYVVRTRDMEPELKFQGCGSDSSSRHLKSVTSAPTSESFGSGSNDLVDEKRKTFVSICTASMAHKLGLWKRNPNFRLRLQPSKIALAPPPQPG